MNYWMKREMYQDRQGCPESETDSDEEAWARRQGETSGTQGIATECQWHKHTKPAQRRDGAAREDKAREEGHMESAKPCKWTNGLTEVPGSLYIRAQARFEKNSTEEDVVALALRLRRAGAGVVEEWRVQWRTFCLKQHLE